MTEIYLGVLSGTSMDAIDVAAYTFPADKLKFIAGYSKALPADYKQKYLKIIEQRACDLVTLGSLDRWTGELFAATVNEFLQQNKLIASDVTAIGSHGQTLWHAPTGEAPFTMQIGDPNIIAARTGITTVADFRRADLAAGGQGAPLAPALHQALFASTSATRSIINIGGISNISILSKGTVTGFDCGPGNCLLDIWTMQHFGQPYDRNGDLAKSGTISKALLEQCLADPYFTRKPPKSSGHEYFNLQWLATKMQMSNCQHEAPQNILSTLTEVTAQSIATAVQQYAAGSEVYICGGGVNNTFLLARLSSILQQQVQSTATLGLDPLWVEAGLFAWLARQNLCNLKTDLTNITKSKQPVLLGAVYR